MDAPPAAVIPESLASQVRRARRVVVVTGAGISAPSGIPTYRERGSGWSDSAMEAKSRASRYGNHLPELWEFWGALHESVTSAVPNPAHLALARWEEMLHARGGWLWVCTQNIDGLHQRAGSQEVAELHGSILHSRCMRCQRKAPTTRPPAPGEVPACTICGGRMRPDVVLFEETLSRPLVAQVEGKLRQADLCMYVGTSGEVWPVSELVTITHQAGGHCVLVNRDVWNAPHPDFHTTVLGPAEELLPQIVASAEE